MFTLLSRDISVGGSVSASSLYDKAKNRYNMHFSDSKMDGRLLVRISPRLISFFYYDYDYDEKEGTFIKDSSYEREVGSISLTRPEHTGRDILAFPQTIQDLELLKDEPKDPNKATKDAIIEAIKYYNNLWAERFWGFPLAEKEQPTDPEDAFRTFLRYCLLCFILEFENRDMAFGESPMYDEVRSHLRQSEVYNLLSAKLHYTLYLHDKESVSNDPERYTFYTREFAERLMNPSLIEAIPPDCYPKRQSRQLMIPSPIEAILPDAFPSGEKEKGKEKQAWFYNPEEELEHILSQNRLTKQKNGCELDSSLVSSIRSFLYTKHAISRAMTTKCSRHWFIVSQVAMLLFNIGLGINCFFDINDGFWKFILNHYILFGLIIVFFVVISGWCNHKNRINAFFPRILVAEVTGWLTIGIVDDLVKSMLGINNTWLILGAIILVFFLVIILLTGEAKQHSPYCSLPRNIWKSALILNHSVFFALFIGLLMQIFFYRNLLETSNVLSDVVYKEHFDKVGGYIQSLEEGEKSINDYMGFVQDYEFGSTQMSGSNHGITGIQGGLKFYSKGHPIDSLTLSLENRINIGTSLNPSVNEDIYSFHDALVENVNASVKEIRDLHAMIGIGDEGNKNLADTLSKIMQNLSKEDKINIITANIMRKNTMMPFLKKEIRESRKHLTDECFDTMLVWATRGEDVSGQYSSNYINQIIKNDTQQKHCYKMYGFFGIKGEIFYSLLLLHMLVVLVLAFIGQLVVSDKSVTEPL